MRYGTVIVMSALVVLTGCGPEPSKEKKPQATQKNKKQTEGYLGTVLKQPKQTQKKVNLYGIQQSIQAFKVLNGRNPRSLKELESSGYAIPPAPKGMEYRYDPMSGKIALKKKPKGGE